MMPKVKYQYELDLITEEMHVKFRKGRDTNGNYYIRKDELNLITQEHHAILYRVNKKTYDRVKLDDEEWKQDEDLPAA